MLVLHDWVYSSLDDKYYQLNEDDIYSIIKGYDDGIEEILLTDEILRKNNIIVYPSGTIAIYDRYRSLITISDEGLKVNVFGKDVEVKYVNQIQQLLRLIGLDDIANNFIV